MPTSDTAPSREAILDAAQATGGNLAAMGRRLGRDRSVVTRRVDKLDLRAEVERIRAAARTGSAVGSLDERDPLDPERIAEDRTKLATAHYRTENNRLRAELAKREETVERIMAALAVPVDVPRYDLAKTDKTLPVRSAVLPIYDIQYGQHVSPSDVPLRQGGHTSQTFDEKLARYLKAVTGSLRDYAASHRVDELVIPLGGDLVEGYDIFAGQAWQLDKNPAEQTRDLAAHLANAIKALVKVAKEEIGVERIAVLSVPGNHGKVGGKRAGALPTTMSWDWLTVEILGLHLQGQPIDLWVNEPAGSLLFETAGHTFLQIHGDEIQGHSGIPFYGLTKFDGKAMRLARCVYDYCLLGHHHQQSSIPNGSGGEFLMSGDWIGGNNLSKYLMAASRPQQRLLFVSRRFGITETVPIYLEDQRRREPVIHAIEAAA
jgi:hypothetical protein